mmetsp:Transcript_45296/g.107786  ORF Transcript_45296/g.107786 Transcript_45296/m.107786 type:complete len:812 (-) Transcript_45296:9-2444(-)
MLQHNEICDICLVLAFREGGAGCKAGLQNAWNHSLSMEEAVGNQQLLSVAEVEQGASQHSRDQNAHTLQVHGCLAVDWTCEEVLVQLYLRLGEHLAVVLIPHPLPRVLIVAHTLAIPCWRCQLASHVLDHAWGELEILLAASKPSQEGLVSICCAGMRQVPTLNLLIRLPPFVELSEHFDIGILTVVVTAVVLHELDVVDLQEELTLVQAADGLGRPCDGHLYLSHDHCLLPVAVCLLSVEWLAPDHEVAGHGLLCHVLAVHEEGIQRWNKDLSNESLFPRMVAHDHKPQGVLRCLRRQLTANGLRLRVWRALQAIVAELGCGHALSEAGDLLGMVHLSVLLLALHVAVDVEEGACLLSNSASGAQDEGCEQVVQTQALRILRTLLCLLRSVGHAHSVVHHLLVPWLATVLLPIYRVEHLPHLAQESLRHGFFLRLVGLQRTACTWELSLMPVAEGPPQLPRFYVPSWDLLLDDRQELCLLDHGLHWELLPLLLGEHLWLYHVRNANVFLLAHHDLVEVLDWCQQTVLFQMSKSQWHWSVHRPVDLLNLLVLSVHGSLQCWQDRAHQLLGAHAGCRILLWTFLPLWQGTKLCSLHQQLQCAVLVLGLLVGLVEETLSLLGPIKDLRCLQPRGLHWIDGVALSPQSACCHNNNVDDSARVMECTEGTQDHIPHLDSRFAGHDVLLLHHHDAEGKADERIPGVLGLWVCCVGEEQVPEAEHRECWHVGGEQSHECTIEHCGKLEADGVQEVPQRHLVVGQAHVKQMDVFHGTTSDTEFTTAAVLRFISAEVLLERLVGLCPDQCVQKPEHRAL